MLTRYTWESQKKKLQHYKRRQPKASVLYQIVFHSHQELPCVWESRFQHQYGCLRDETTKTLTEYLNCGILAHGAARVPPPIPMFIDTLEAIHEIPSYDSFEPAPDEF